jgi:hypothetical protein
MFGLDTLTITASVLRCSLAIQFLLLLMLAATACAALLINDVSWSTVLQDGEYWLPKRRLTRLAQQLLNAPESTVRQKLDKVCTGRDRAPTAIELAYFKEKGDISQNSGNIMLVRIQDAAEWASSIKLPAAVCQALADPVPVVSHATLAAFPALPGQQQQQQHQQQQQLPLFAQHAAAVALSRWVTSSATDT